MIKTSTIAAAATLALAALPMLALATNAQAAPVAVKVVDINTLSADGAAAYGQRVDAAAVRFCHQANPNMRLTERATCIAAVKSEMSEKLRAHNAVMAAKTGATLVASK